MAAKRALICGVSGQDGAYLAKLLLDKGYEVYGASRDARSTSFHNLAVLGIEANVHLLSMNLTDFQDVLQGIVRVEPEEIYNLAGQTSVSLSFERPLETFESISSATLNILEALRRIDGSLRLFIAGSGECFGDTRGLPADEATPFHPISPYAAAKAAAFWEVSSYRSAYKLYACTAILFNHESPLRHERFVTRKIVASACRIASGINEKLRLGNVSVVRDWGWAPEYVEAMWRMLQQESPVDFILATGETNSLQEFVAETFAHLGLDWREHVISDVSLLRPNEILFSGGDPAGAERLLEWKARSAMKDVIRMMVDAERGLQKR